LVEILWKNVWLKIAIDIKYGEIWGAHAEDGMPKTI
jgi:hypothetical protein